jgi:hypothetical protein
MRQGMTLLTSLAAAKKSKHRLPPPDDMWDKAEKTAENFHLTKTESSYSQRLLQFNSNTSTE